MPFFGRLLGQLRNKWVVALLILIGLVFGLLSGWRAESVFRQTIGLTATLLTDSVNQVSVNILTRLSLPIAEWVEQVFFKTCDAFSFGLTTFLCDLCLKLLADS